MAQVLFSNSSAVFQDDNSPVHTARSVHSCFDEDEDSLQCLPWSAQSPNLNIIEPLLSVVENSVRSRFLPSSSASN
jgi:hypothetical protein